MRHRPIMSEATQAFSFTRRAWILGAGQGLFGVALAARMGWLAVAENERYNLLSESNRVDMTLMPPRRGWLLDRNGLPIANNRTDFRIDIIPDRFHEPDRVLPLLGRLLQLPDDEMARLRIDLKRAAGFQPVQVAERLDWERFAAVSVRLPELPGVVPTRGFARHYPAGAAVAHLTGYVGAATAEQFKETRDQLYVTPGFKLGKDGLEKTLEPVLRGQAGAKRIEVTAGGKLVQPLETKLDEPGRNVRLTIDAGLQEYAARRLGPHSGSAVVMDCRTGELLATVSMPAYDPNSFSDGISQLEWKMLSDDDHVPLMNKIAQGLYPPGSTVKPMNSLALLKAGVSPADRVSCSGALRVGSGVFHCHKRRGHGSVDMRQAVALSCDIYFYEMARRIGYDAFAPVAKSLGMGERFDLPFGTQRYGTVPDSAWKLKKYKDKWTVADTLNSSIGQGYVLSNPLQLCVMAARIASGRVVQPTLLARRVDRNPPVLDATPEHLAVVRDAMWAVVNGGGTAGRARLKVPGVELAGKTGTAQVRRITMAERRSGVLGDSSLPFKLRDHSLFMGFAPAAEPRYAVAVVLEHSGHIVTAAPMASDIITYLYDRERALKTLEPLEKDWGGDIATRLAAQSVAYKAARDAEAGVATRIDGVVPSEAPAVEAAAALATEAQAALLALGDGGVARDGTTEQAQ